MGLIKAASGAITGTLADEWKEYFYCDSMEADVLVQKGVKRTSKRSSNTKGEENVITDGSHIAVADGECILIVEDGKVLDVCADPGAYTYQTGTSPSVFGGKFLEGLSDSVKEAWRRFQFGGGAGKDQRIYYINIKEIIGNKYGTSSPIPFHVTDKEINMSLDISIRCNGEYSYKIVNPMAFYTNVCGNVASTYTRDKIDSMMKSELLTALQPAFARISEQGVRYSGITAHTQEIADALNEELSKKWTELRGVQIVSFGLNSATASEEDIAKIQKYQTAAMLKDPAMGAAVMADAMPDAMKAAAANANGSMMGFMGMGMAMQTGNQQISGMYQQAQQQQMMGAQMQQMQQPVQQPMQQAQMQQPMQQAQEIPADQVASAGKQWFCPNCGNKNNGNFCINCGTKRPEGF